MEKQFLEFMAGVMEVPATELNLKTAYEDYERWDSMMHMRLVMEIENEYGVEIPIDEIPEIDTLGKFYTYICR
ncbi:acyl carrier protein [Sporofaciens musculi]|uniref:acyl carrier protein n=1 Tax=Sporofaciens musculi TaxID=2681861 RepID=UPI0021745298|nr:acyl carrier protein [Sporofaciens musculi]MCI9421894.1 acyl carrier protein [Dorea sp.]